MKSFSVLFASILLIIAIVATTTSAQAPSTPTVIEMVMSTQNGYDWRFTNQNQSYQGSATVPGDIFGDLMAHSMIPDINWRYNCDNISWAAYENWTYTTLFNLDVASQNQQQDINSFPIVLVIDSIRVVANISVNGIHIGKTNDEFVKYEFLLPAGKLNATGNVLRVDFLSTVIYAQQQHDAYPISPRPDAPPYIDEYPFRNFVRTEQSSFAWDWGLKSAQVSLISSPRLLLYAPQQNTTSSHHNHHLLSSLQRQEIADDIEKLPISIDYITPHIFSLPSGAPVLQPLNDTSNSFLVDTYIYASCWGSVDCFRDGTLAEIRIADSVSGTSYTLIGKNSTASWTFYDDNTPNGEPNPNTNRCSASTSAVALPCKAYGRVQITVQNVKLWWPREIQDDPSKIAPAYRYGLTVQIVNRKGHTLAATANPKGIGFRAVELITRGDPLDFGLPTPNPPRNVMFFRVNGIPVFARGANVVPFDTMPSRITYGVIDQIFESAALAHMNILRVWGGGIFQSEKFYDIADEKGFMIWQEMIFACAQYPINPEFLLNVRQEIRHQLRRLGHRPSIIMWSGNNENGIYDEGPDSPYEILDYDTVLHEIIRQDTSRVVWPSSPSSGFASGVTQSGLPAGTMENPAPFVVGGKTKESHWYDYQQCPDLAAFPRTNFASEFGFQSLPWLDALAQISLPEDWNLFSPFFLWRQHHPNGQQEMASLIEQNFGTPPGFWNQTGVDVFRKAIYLSQLQQVLCIENEASFYRRSRIDPQRTSGSMYWQLNVDATMPSWTSVQYGGEWQLLHYRMQIVYSKIFVSAFVNTSDGVGGGSATVQVDSDMLNVTQCTNGLEVYLLPTSQTASSVQNGDPLEGYLIDRVSHLTIFPLRGVRPWKTMNIQQNLIAAHPDRCPDAAHCFLLFRLACSDVLYNYNPMRPTPLFLAPIAEMGQSGTALLPTQVTLWYLTTENDEIKFTVQVNVTTFYLVLTAPKPYNIQGTFSTNGFLALPGTQNDVITFKCMNYDQNPCNVSNINGEQFVQGITVQSLNNDGVF